LKIAIIPFRKQEKRKPQPDEWADAYFRRLILISIVFAIGFLAVIGKLIYLQIVEHEKYVNLAGKSQFETNIIPAQRGTIYDRNGNILAMDVPVRSVFVNVRQVDDVENTAKVLSSILNIPVSEVREKLSSRKYVCVKRKATIEEVTRLQQAHIEGIEFEDEYQRFYPKERLACHVLGFTDIDGIGLEGVEKYYDSILGGKPGKVAVLRDGRGNRLVSFGRILAKPERGHDIWLAIDEHIQQVVEEEIAKGFEQFHPRQISVVVMDPVSGEILALANKPDYDLNRYGQFSPEIRRNHAVCDMFEPGSVFKITTASAVFEEKKVQMNEPIACEGGRWFVRGHILHDAHPYGTLTFQDVLIKSSNIGTVKLAMRLGEEKLYEYLQRFELGKLTGIDLPGEIRGKLRPLERWSSFSITAIPIGQEVGVTCLQAIRTMAVLANGGYLVTPHVLLRADRDEGKFRSFPKIGPILSNETVTTISQILSHVVSQEGTAARAQISGYRICGKTGTGQKFINGAFSHSKFYASFVGFLPLEKPRVVILVNVDEPQGAYYGGAVAAPIFREIAWRIMQYMDIPPDNVTDNIAFSGQLNETQRRD